MHRIRLLFVVTLLFGIMGCGHSQMVKDSWKFTTRQYRTYLNTPATLDMADKGSCELYELALGDAVLNIDAELQKLVRAMENSDHNPDQNWVMGMMGRIPWLSGVAIVDKDNAIVAQYPEYFSKPFDASPLLEPDPKQRMGDLRAYVQMSDAGPEIYIGNPVYSGEDLRGVITAYFDPRALVLTSSDPGSFILASPAGILWPGRYGSGSLVSSENWEERLKKESCGILGDSKTGFFWTTRYIGNLPIVYAMPVSAGQPAAESQPSRPPAEQGPSEVPSVPVDNAGPQAPLEQPKDTPLPADSPAPAQPAGAPSAQEPAPAPPVAAPAPVVAPSGPDAVPARPLGVPESVRGQGDGLNNPALVDTPGEQPPY